MAIHLNRNVLTPSISPVGLGKKEASKELAPLAASEQGKVSTEVSSSADSVASKSLVKSETRIKSGSLPMVLLALLASAESAASAGSGVSKALEISFSCNEGVFSGVTKNGNPYHGDTEFRCLDQGKERSFHTTWQAGQKTNGTGFSLCGTTVRFHSWSDGQGVDSKFDNSCSLNWKNGETGFATYVLRNGNLYQGEWKNRKQHGKGHEIEVNGDVYKGDFVDGEREGKGWLNFSVGIYEGEFSHGEFHGLGNVLYDNGIRYEGKWEKGNRSYGIVTYPDRSTEKRDFINGSEDTKGLYNEYIRSYEGEFSQNQYHGLGKVTFFSGGFYNGEWRNGKKHGNGHEILGNGDEYKGDFVDGKRHGNGHEILGNGDEYKGDFVDGEREGQGWWKDSGGVYEGGFRQGEFHGLGKVTLTNGEIYEGEWKDGKRHGKGHVIYENGNEYKGDFVDGKKDGQGWWKDSDGVYEGGFSQGKFHGKGQQVLENEDEYKGDFVDGEREGQGWWKDSGGVYEGGFRQGEFHGLGKVTLTNGEIYEGEWKDGKRHGKGHVILENGDEYKGDFVDGKMHGQGWWKDSDGIYEGGYSQGKFHGKGQLTLENGDEYKGDFVDGKKDGYGWWKDSGGIYEGGFRQDQGHWLGKITRNNGEIESGLFLDGKFVVSETVLLVSFVFGFSPFLYVLYLTLTKKTPLEKARNWLETKDPSFFKQAQKDLEIKIRHFCKDKLDKKGIKEIVKQALDKKARLESNQEKVRNKGVNPHTPPKTPPKAVEKGRVLVPQPFERGESELTRLAALKSFKERLNLQLQPSLLPFDSIPQEVSQAQLKGDLSEATFVGEIRQRFQDFENAKKTIKKSVGTLKAIPEDGATDIQEKIEGLERNKQALAKVFETLEAFKIEMDDLQSLTPKVVASLKEELEIVMTEFKKSSLEDLEIMLNSMRRYNKWLNGMLEFPDTKGCSASVQKPVSPKSNTGLQKVSPKASVGLKTVLPKASASSKIASFKANTETKTDEIGLTVDQFEKRGNQITFVKLMASELYGTEEDPKVPSVSTVINVLSMLALLRAEASKAYDHSALEYRNVFFHPQGSKSDISAHYQNILLPIVDTTLYLDAQHEFHENAKALLRLLSDRTCPNPEWKVVDESLKDLRDISRDVFKLQRFKQGGERTQKLKDMFRQIGDSYYKMSQKDDSGSTREKLESYIQNFIGPDQLLSLQYANILVKLDGGSIDKEDWIESVTKFLRNGTAHRRELDAGTLIALTILVERAYLEMRDKESAQSTSTEPSDMLREVGTHQHPFSPEAPPFVPLKQARSK